MEDANDHPGPRVPKHPLMVTASTSWAGSVSPRGSQGEGGTPINSSPRKGGTPRDEHWALDEHLWVPGAAPERRVLPGVGERNPTPPAPLTSSRAPTAPRHFCILEAKAAAAGELRSSPVTAKNSATLSCSGIVRPHGGRPGQQREGAAGALGAHRERRPGPAQRPMPRTGSARPAAPGAPPPAQPDRSLPAAVT